MTIMELRDSAHQQIHRNPENEEQILRHYAKALLLVDPPINCDTFCAFIMELFRRAELAEHYKNSG